MFGVPVVLTAVESEDFDGAIAPQLHALFPISQLSNDPA